MTSRSNIELSKGQCSVAGRQEGKMGGSKLAPFKRKTWLWPQLPLYSWCQVVLTCQNIVGSCNLLTDLDGAAYGTPWGGGNCRDSTYHWWTRVIYSHQKHDTKPNHAGTVAVQKSIALRSEIYGGLWLLHVWCHQREDSHWTRPSGLRLCTKHDATCNHSHTHTWTNHPKLRLGLCRKKPSVYQEGCWGLQGSGVLDKSSFGKLQMWQTTDSSHTLSAVSSQHKSLKRHL